MVFVKVVKDKSYYKRFQVKLRRRREGKTDYQARRRLVNQDQNKYGSPKYRFIVRMTNKKIIVQVAYTTILGDRILCSANSHELMAYGIHFGLTNYAAAYATGLLCAKRVCKLLNLDAKYQGVEFATGEDYHVEDLADEDHKPFKASLDVGLVRTTKGNRVFGAMKGACDGGLYIPHSTKKFPGSTSDGNGNTNYNAEDHRARILGLHVANYMNYLKEEDMDKFKSHFSYYINNDIQPDQIEELYLKCHEAIRNNPNLTSTKDTIKKTSCYRDKNFIVSGNKKYFRPPKLTLSQKKDRLKRKIHMIAETKMQNS